MFSYGITQILIDKEGNNMKKLLPFLLTFSLAYGFAMPLMAEQTTEEAPKVEETTPSQDSQPKSDEQQLQGFMVRHQISSEQVTKGTQVKPDPFTLLHTLKADIVKYLQDNKPLKLKTTVTPLFSERLSKELEGIPSLLLETFIGKDGKGETKFDIPKYIRTVPEDENGGEVYINWGGLDGQFDYPDTFETITADITLQGLNIEEKDAFAMDMRQLAFVADLDKDLLPVKIDTDLAVLAFRDENSIMVVLNDLELKTEMQKTASQVEINTGSFVIGDSGLGIAKKPASKFKQLKFTFGGEEQKGIANFTSQFSIKRLELFETIVDEGLKLNHKMDVALNNLDAPATAQLQQTVRELKNQLHSGKISEDILNFAMFGQLMQLAPAFLAKSPEIVLSNIVIDTNTKGDLKGDLKLGINGKKAKSLNNMMELLMAMTMQADFNINKPLLKLGLTATLGSEGQADTRIKALIKDKTLVETEDSYILSATIVDNKLTLNGQDMGAPMDLFMLLMPLAIQ